jgi:hypothetical protein
MTNGDDVPTNTSSEIDGAFALFGYDISLIL